METFTFNVTEDSSFDDQDTWDLISSGKTKGVFQLESSLGKSWAKRVKPQNIEELAALISIIRPGTLKAIQDGKSMTQRFVDRKNLTEEITYLDQSLRPILENTQGVLVYQEQSMQIAQKIAGFNLEEADDLRKAIGKKKAGLMAKIKKRFISGAAREKVVNKDVAEEIFGWIEKSSRYAFNKSHAVSYAICAYWSAFCKTHYPINFYCNYLLYASGKPDPQQEVKELVNDAKNREIYINPPSINSLNSETDIIDGEICFGLTDIKSIGMKQIEKFKLVITFAEIETLEKPLIDWSWYEFLVLTSPLINSPVVVALISIGFFSHLPESRQQMLDQFDTWNSLTKKEQEWAVDSYSKYKNLTILLKAMTPTKKKGGATFNANRSSILKDLVYHLENPAYSLKDDPEWVIRTEENYLGVSLTYSRIEIYDTHLADTNIREFIDGKKKSNAKIAVTISEVRRYTIKSGKMEGLEMAFLCVEDDTGTLDTVTIFSEKWKEYKSQLYEGNNVILCRASSRRKGRRVDDGFIIDRVIELG